MPSQSASMTAGVPPPVDPPVFAIRAAAPGDLPAIQSMIAALAEYEKLSHLCVATEADLADALFGPRRFAEVLISCKDGEVAAFALFFHNFSTFLGRPGLWLEDLFVLPAHRRQGCAQALLRALAQIARERGCGRFEWAVLDWNAPAIAFYESLGAAILPDWRIARVVGPALARLAGGGGTT
jgi:GNAT superfamily N-acetyltransferase